jgi:chromosomal replication initiator protein
MVKENNFIPQAGAGSRAPTFSGSRQLGLPYFNGHRSKGRLLRKDFTFDRFVVGKNSDFAYSAALSLATNGMSNQNSLFLLAKTGLGKSHLSQAIAHKILSVLPREQVYYITAEDFANEMIRAIRGGLIDSFKEKYRSMCDVLLLEDIHLLSGKERTQTELSQALDYLHEADKKIIFTSCYPPGDIPKVNEQLRSRIASSLISAIDPPNFSTRVRILLKKAEENGYHLPDDVTEYMAAKLSDNVRQLEGGLIGLAARSSLLGSPITLNLAKSVVKNLAGQDRTITIDLVKKLVCRDFGITLKDIVSRSRKKDIVRPRQIAIFLSRRYTDKSLQVISKSFNRQHATAIYAIGAVEKEMKTSRVVRKQVEFLCQKLDSGNF